MVRVKRVKKVEEIEHNDDNIDEKTGKRYAESNSKKDLDQTDIGLEIAEELNISEPEGENDINAADTKEPTDANEVQEEVVSSIWEVHHDNEGTIFYWNTVTEESQWEMPEELAGKELDVHIRESISLAEEVSDEEGVMVYKEQESSVLPDDESVASTAQSAHGNQSEDSQADASRKEHKDDEDMEYSDSEERRIEEDFEDILEVLPKSLIEEIGEKRLRNFWKHFQKIDDDNTGSLDIYELASLINMVMDTSDPGGGEQDGPATDGEPAPSAPRKIEPDDPNLQALFDEADVDVNGTLDFVEALEVFKMMFGSHHEGRFLNAMEGIPADLAEFFGEQEIRDLHAYFDKIDTDGSGHLDLHELRELVMLVSKKRKPPSNRKMKKLIKEVDLDNTGTVDFLEFLTVYKNMKEGKTTELGKAFEASRGVLMVANIGKGVAEDLVKYRNHFNNWLNAEEIEEEKKRQRRLERARKRKEDEEKRNREDQQFYEQYLEAKKKREEERKRPIEGIDINVLFEGDNETYANDGDTCTLHYIGYYKGKEFVSTRTFGRGTPISFTMGNSDVLVGWELAVKKITLGAKAEIKLQPKFCYGQRGLPPLVEPNSELTFVIDLLRIDTNDESDEEVEEEEGTIDDKFSVAPS